MIPRALRPWHVLLLGVCWAAANSVATIAASPLQDKSPEIFTTPEGVRFGIWPERPTRPVPTLFVFSGAINDALGSSTFRQSGNQLAEQGWLCVSLDLPCHGEDSRPGESGLSGWRARCLAGTDFVTAMNERARRVLDHLIAERWTDPKRVAALGTSRGGFIAVHFAAAEPRVRCVAAFAPVTDLRALSEFRGAEENPLVQRLSLQRQAEQLAERPIWLVIGDRDQRVSTDRAIEFTRRVTTAAIERKKSPQVELHVLPEPRGHTTPAGSPQRAAEWFDRMIKTP